MSGHQDDEEGLLRSVALRNATTILRARQRAEAELLRTREALRESEERLQRMFNQAAVGIAVAGLDGRFQDMNRKFLDVLGYEADELRTMTFRDITFGEDLELTNTSVDRLVAGAISEYALEKRYVRKDGRVVWSLTTVTLLKDAAGRPQRFLGVVEDITARKDVEAALREETRILELLNETGTLLASNLNLQALVHAVTDAATRLSGAEFGAFLYNRTDASGDAYTLYALSGATREAFDRFADPRATALFGPTLCGEGTTRIHDVLEDPRCSRMASHDGMPQGHLQVRGYLAVPVTSRTGEVIGGLFFGHSTPGVFNERTERLIVGIASQAGVAIDNARLYEAAQRAAEERQALLESERAARGAAERLSEIKDDFLATLSHELRTPLNAILGWSKLLRQNTGDPAELMRGLDTIERNAHVQTQLIEDLLDMSRVATGKLRLDIQPLRPAQVVDAAVETVTPAAHAKGIRLQKIVDPLAGPISGDPARLQQVIWNLLSNAIKFTPRGGKVQVTVERVNSHVEISVADTGVGIRPEFLPYLFDRFRQADASTTRVYGGLGLGLSIVKSLVELHGGSVEAHSPGEGLGTRISVRLPLMAVVRPDRQPADRPRDPDEANPAPFAPADLSGVRVLVVDDQPDTRDLVRRLLEGCAATVVTAGTVDEAIHLAETMRPDVLVSDIGMPGADGYELLRRVRALGPERGGRAPAIALTAFARTEDRTRALRAGFLVHLAKPVDPAELVATVASVAGRFDAG